VVPAQQSLMFEFVELGMDQGPRQLCQRRFPGNEGSVVPRETRLNPVSPWVVREAIENEQALAIDQMTAYFAASARRR
jgi:hypothetical protein